ncbi:putative Triosephosphate isomerase [Cladorrhinum sp. PSN332]|nr:putative Triosephosphate isomerase [Cladorrhinum sp. PSN332]
MSSNPTATDTTGPAPAGYPRGGSATASAPAPALTSTPAKENTRKKRIIGVSTKMYFSAARTDSFIREVCHHLLRLEDLWADEENAVEVFVIPDFLSITPAVEVVNGAELLRGKVIVGAQDCHFEDEGAFTGEVSPRVLREVGCGIVELGHSERQEEESIVREKVRGVVRNGMVPLVCVGEGEKGDDVEGVGREVVRQVLGVLGGLGGDEEVIVAYEPVWAIGKSEPAGDEYVRRVVRVLRRELEGRGLEKVRIIYGGSAGPGLWERLEGEVDGLFLGRFGHDAASGSDADGPFVVVRRGTIASGELVMRSGKLRDDLAKQYDALCFETEAAGLLMDFPCMVIRGMAMRR